MVGGVPYTGTLLRATREGPVHITVSDASTGAGAALPLASVRAALEVDGAPGALLTDPARGEELLVHLACTAALVPSAAPGRRLSLRFEPHAVRGAAASAAAARSSRRSAAAAASAPPDAAARPDGPPVASPPRRASAVVEAALRGGGGAEEEELPFALGRVVLAGGDTDGGTTVDLRCRITFDGGVAFAAAAAAAGGRPRWAVELTHEVAAGLCVALAAAERGGRPVSDAEAGAAHAAAEAAAPRGSGGAGCLLALFAAGGRRDAPAGLAWLAQLLRLQPRSRGGAAAADALELVIVPPMAALGPGAPLAGAGVPVAAAAGVAAPAPSGEGAASDDATRAAGGVPGGSGDDALQHPAAPAAAGVVAAAAAADNGFGAAAGAAAAATAAAGPRRWGALRGRLAEVVQFSSTLTPAARLRNLARLGVALIERGAYRVGLAALTRVYVRMRVCCSRVCTCACACAVPA